MSILFSLKNLLLFDFNFTAQHILKHTLHSMSLYCLIELENCDIYVMQYKQSPTIMRSNKVA